jgi:hypothetical protein
MLDASTKLKNSSKTSLGTADVTLPCSTKNSSKLTVVGIEFGTIVKMGTIAGRVLNAIEKLNSSPRSSAAHENPT